jgi:peptide deformylase
MYRIPPHKENPVLRAKARVLSREEISSEKTLNLIRAMKELLEKEEHGVAIAAPQVGEPLRLFVVAEKALPTKTTPSVYINPEIISESKARSDKSEGCLSVRGFWGIVSRAEKVRLRAYNEKGERFVRGASGLLAHIFQHEMDHLDGILYIDKASRVEKETTPGEAARQRKKESS